MCNKMIGPNDDIPLEKSDEKATDVNIKIFESTRAELIQRINLRDGALLFYIATMGAYLNNVVTYHYSDVPDRLDFMKAMLLMMPLPFTCVIFTLVILQHHLIIGRMGHFLRFEMNWGKLAPKISPHWDNSSAFLSQANLLIRLRLYAQVLVLALPTGYFIAFFMRFYKSAIAGGDSETFLLWFLCLCNIISASFILWAHIDTHSKRKKDWENYPTFRNS